MLKSSPLFLIILAGLIWSGCHTTIDVTAEQYQFQAGEKTFRYWSTIELQAASFLETTMIESGSNSDISPNSDGVVEMQYATELNRNLANSLKAAKIDVCDSIIDHNSQEAIITRYIDCNFKRIQKSRPPPCQINKTRCDPSIGHDGIWSGAAGAKIIDNLDGWNFQSAQIIGPMPNPIRGLESNNNTISFPGLLDENLIPGQYTYIIIYEDPRNIRPDIEITTNICFRN